MLNVQQFVFKKFIQIMITDQILWLETFKEYLPRNTFWEVVFQLTDM